MTDERIASGSQHTYDNNDTYPVTKPHNPLHGYISTNLLDRPTTLCWEYQ